MSLISSDENLASTVSPVIVGASLHAQEIRAFLEKAAGTQHTVLLQGPTGAGKDKLAECIHDRACSKANMVEVNCVEIPAPLFESELFGHTGGAFTGAKHHKRGLISVAEGGTLFFNEIGEMSLDMQAKLLRVLDKKPFRALGSVESIQIHTRIIVATNKDLRQAVNKELFREDLYHRLCVFEFSVPSLKERQEDIPELVRHFLHEERSEKTFSSEALQSAMQHDWPGNVRELKNAVIRGIAYSGDRREIAASDLRLPTSGYQVQIPTLHEHNRRYFELLLRSTNGNVSKGADVAGISPVQLKAKIKEFDLLDFVENIRKRVVQ